MSDRESRAIYLAEDLFDHEETLSYYKEETHKFRCRILAQQILTFTYFHEMFPTYQHELQNSDINVISDIIKSTSTLLLKEIIQ